MPPQHGAWAFLGLPVIVALPLTSWTPLLVLLAGAWVTAYPASYFVLAIARDSASRHPDPGRYARPLAAWSVAVAVLGLPLLFAQPWLAWVLGGYLGAFMVNLAFARRRDERSLVNDIVLILECTAMVPVTWLVGFAATGSAPALDAVPTDVWIAMVAVALLLAGSTLHVKSLIRERNDPRYARASRLVALLSLLVAVGLAWAWGLPAGAVLVLPFAWFLARSMLLANPSMRPGRLGMIELVGFLLLAGAVAAATWLPS